MAKAWAAAYLLQSKHKKQIRARRGAKNERKGGTSAVGILQKWSRRTGSHILGGTKRAEKLFFR